MRTGISRNAVIVYAIIHEAKIKIDAASEDRNAYKEQEKSGDFEYLGSGYYYSYNGQKATDNKLTHFWKAKKLT